MAWPQNRKAPWGGPRSPWGLHGSLSGPYLILPDPSTDYAVVYVSGQSYVSGTSSGGAGEADELSTIQIQGNLRLVNANSPHGPQTRALVPLVTVGTESFLEGLANEFRRRWAPNQNGLITWHRTAGGTTFADYQSPSGARFLTGMTAVDDAVIEASNSVVVAAIYDGAGWFNEMIAGDPFSGIETGLNNIVDNWRTQLATRTGQTFQPPMFLFQPSWFTLGAIDVQSEYTMGILNLGLNDPDFIMDSPSYFLNVGQDNVHLVDEAYRYFALLRGYITHRVIGLGEDWRPLHATVARVSGAQQVTITYQRPRDSSSLVLDTDDTPTWRETAASATTHGFRYIENLAAARGVTGITVSGDDIIVDLDGAVDPSAQIGYADFGATPPNAPRGNLRTNEVATAEGESLYHFAAAQRITIESGDLINSDTSFPLYGQSLAVGVMGSPALTTTQPHGNLQLNLGHTALVPLIEGLPDFSAVETQASEMCNVARAERGSGIFMSHRSGVAGADIATLSANPGALGDFLDRVADEMRLTIAAGRTYRVRGVAFIHGSADEQTSSTTYAADLLALHTLIEDGINALQGTTGRIPMFLSQLSAFGMTTTGSNVALQQLAATLADPDRFILVDSRQYFTYAGDRLHGTNEDYRQQGRKFGQVMEEVIFQARTWAPFAPTAAVLSGSNVDLTYEVPYPPLAFESGDAGTPFSITPRTNQGYELNLTTIQNDYVTLDSVSLVGTDGVRLGLSNPVGLAFNDVGQPTARYAYTQGSTGAQGGRLNANSPAGNLIDSDPNGYGVNHALHHESTISNLEARPSDVATRSFLFGVSGTERLQIPDGASLDFTNRATWSFIVRFNDITQHNFFIAERGITTGWGLRLFTTGGNRSVVLNIGGGAITYITQGDLFADGEFHQVTITYDGREATAEARIRIEVDGVLATVTIGGGGAPASLSPLALPINIGNITNSLDMNLLHFAHWFTSFTPQQRWESGMVRGAVEFDGTGGVPNPPIFLRPDSGDDPAVASGVINHGSEGSTYHATGTNMTAAANIVTAVP